MKTFCDMMKIFCRLMKVFLSFDENFFVCDENFFSSIDNFFLHLTKKILSYKTVESDHGLSGDVISLTIDLVRETSIFHC